MEKYQTDERDPAGTGTAIQPINPRSFLALPSDWQRSSVPVDWLNKMEAILLHSAGMTGASADDTAITELAKGMIPTLMRLMPLEALDAVYTRWLDTNLLRPDMKSVMVNAHDLMSTYALIQAELAAQRAEEAETKANNLRVAEQMLARSHKRQVYSIADLARRDGVALPYATSGAEKPQEARQEGTQWNTLDPTDLEYTAQLERNRESYLRLLAESEHNRAHKPGKGE